MRSIEIGAPEAGRLNQPLPHLRSVTHVVLTGPRAIEAVATTNALPLLTLGDEGTTALAELPLRRLRDLHAAKTARGRRAQTQ